VKFLEVLLPSLLLLLGGWIWQVGVVVVEDDEGRQVVDKFSFPPHVHLVEPDPGVGDAPLDAGGVDPGPGGSDDVG
jgi:hypothetical protein